ncbi:hypothetical protein ACUH88_04275 [Dermabacteraceae bacterium P13095]
MKTRKIYPALAAALLLLPLAGCGNTAPAAATKTAAPKPKLTAEETVKEFIKQDDKVARGGWKDPGLADSYLTPEHAKGYRQSAADNYEKRGKYGQHLDVITEVSDLTLDKESSTDTKAVVEFCQKTPTLRLLDKNGKDIGKPDIGREAEEVSRYTLVRKDTSSPWQVAKFAHYEKGVTCANYFGE